MHKKSLIAVFVTCILLCVSPVSASEISAGLRNDLSAFFGVSPERISVECPQQSYRLEEEQGGKILNICLNKADNQNRCEIAIHDLPRSPAKTSIEFQVNYADETSFKRWQSLMQIHSFPDEGEEWRCAPITLEIKDGNFRVMDRWDATTISRTFGDRCAERGSSISGRQLIDDIKVRPGEWQDVKIDAKLSYGTDGELHASVDGRESPLVLGPNIFNDQKKNFLKFGFYNPAGWEDGHGLSCVRYRNVKIKTDG